MFVRVLLKKYIFCVQTSGVLCSFDKALVQLIYFEKKKQRSMPWNADLQIGSELKIKVSAFINVRQLKPNIAFAEYIFNSALY